MIKGDLPTEAVQIFLFNAQTCETTFRSAGAMSGAFSSIVNFSVTDFLRRVQKLSVLNRIKSENEIQKPHSSTLKFPSHHKQFNPTFSASSTPLTTLSLASCDIEKIVSLAFHGALDLMSKVNAVSLLKRKKLHTFRSLNNFVFMKMKTLSKTFDPSNLTDVSSDTKSEPDETSSLDHSSELESEDEANDEPSEIHHLYVAENSIRGVRVFDSSR